MKWILQKTVEVGNESREIWISEDGMFQKLVVYSGFDRIETISFLG